MGARHGNAARTVVLPAGADALLGVERTLELGHVRVGVDSTEEDGLELHTNEHPLSDLVDEPTWFMPAFAKSSVGSSKGMVGDDGQKTWFFWRKKSKNCWRMLGADQGPV